MRNGIAIAVVGLMMIVAPAYAQATGELTQADVDAALANRRAAGSSLEALTTRFDQAMFDEEILRERIIELSGDVADLEQDIVVRRAKVAALVVSRYMAGGLSGTERVFNAREFTDLPVQAEYLKRLNAADVAVLDGLLASESRQVQQQESLDASLVAQREIVAELTAMAQELSAALTAADAEYEAVTTAFIRQEEERKAREEAERKAREAEERRRAEAARKAAAAASTTTTIPVTTTTAAPTTTTTAPAPTTTTTVIAGDDTTTTTAPAPPAIDGKTCPVDAANSFSDTWGAARSGGRTHKGVDIFAARNARLVAIESGTVTRTSNSSLGGISIYLTGSSGNRYYYAHLEFIADGVGAGTSVGVGDTLGGVGTTGNAPAWLPMLHFQYAPPGSEWVNPYPLAKSLCG